MHTHTYETQIQYMYEILHKESMDAFKQEHIYTQSKLSVKAPPKYGSTLNTFSALRVTETKKIDTTKTRHEHTMLRRRDFAPPTKRYVVLYVRYSSDIIHTHLNEHYALRIMCIHILKKPKSNTCTRYYTKKYGCV